METRNTKPPLLRVAGIALGLVLNALVLAGAAYASECKIAVAANFTAPARDIAALYEKLSGDTVLLSFGASGQFYALIAQGAPYDAFLSADADRPVQAEKAGLAVAGTRFTYAVGKLALWSRDPSLVDDDGTVLAIGNFSHLAIADPKLAPYGAAAIETMRKMGVLDDLRAKFVTGSSITQAYQFVKTGNAELGFVALSQVKKNKTGSLWIVPEWMHPPIVQQAVLLNPGADNTAAKGFLAFLKSDAARAVILKYGYGL
jgi:molybdate transport system substrate-binding protein